jgi:ribosome-associated protein
MHDDDLPKENETQGEPTSSDLTTGLPRRRQSKFVVAQDETPTRAVSHSDPARLGRALEFARQCAGIAFLNRARDIVILDVRASTPLVDYFVIATAASRRQAAAIADEISVELKRRDERKLGIEGADEGRWILMDYGDFVVHIFDPDTRAYYALEEIWADAETVTWEEPPRVGGPAPTAEPTPPAPDTLITVAHDDDDEDGEDDLDFGEIDEDEDEDEDQDAPGRPPDA